MHLDSILHRKPYTIIRGQIKITKGKMVYETQQVSLHCAAALFYYGVLPGVK
jgi:hypothetical protein